MRRTSPEKEASRPPGLGHFRLKSHTVVVNPEEVGLVVVRGQYDVKRYGVLLANTETVILLIETDCKLHNSQISISSVVNLFVTE